MILRLPTLHHAVLTTAVVFLTISTSNWAKTPSEVRAACRAESLDHPPAVKRSTAVFDSGTEGCLRQPQATRGQVLRV